MAKKAIHIVLKVYDEKAEAYISMGPCASQFLSVVEGRKRMITTNRLRFEPTEHNLSEFRRLFPDAPVEDFRVDGTDICEGEAFFESHATSPQFEMKTPPFAQHQSEAFEKAKGKKAFALFMEQGTGKTWVALKKALHHYNRGEIEGVFVATYKGVHEQWVEEQIPTHMSEDTPLAVWSWDKKEYKRWGYPAELNDRAALSFLTMNIDALSTKTGHKCAKDYIKKHDGKVLFIIDESHLIRNNNSGRTKVCHNLGGLCSHRMILTGTPQGKTLLDQWPQYKFLDESILGERYKTTFRNKYCIMGGYEGKQVVGTKNIENFRKKVAPYTYRITKKEGLDLPEKVYSRWRFSLEEKSRQHYDDLKKNYLTLMEDGEVAEVQNAAVLVTRLHQLARGWLVTDEGEQRVGHEAINALKDLVESSHDEKIIIWARFRKDIESILDLFGNQAVAYYGGMSNSNLRQSKQSFLSPSGARFFVANPAVGGMGLDGLQDVCSTVVYYSNGYDAIERWQSEDRTHRKGTKHSVNYIDLVAKNTVDVKLLNNLRSKKSLSDLALGDIMEIIKNG